MRTVATATFFGYLGIAALLVAMTALEIGNWKPGYTVTFDLTIFSMLVLLGPFLLGIFIGRHQS